jgi:hypothetical protein
MLGQYMTSPGFGMYGNLEYGFGTTGFRTAGFGAEASPQDPAIAAAEKKLADATVAMNKPECPGPGGALLPAVTCKPELAKKVEEAANQLAALKGGGGGKMKFVVGGLVLAAAVGGFLWWKSQAI